MVVTIAFRLLYRTAADGVGTYSKYIQIIESTSLTTVDVVGVYSNYIQIIVSTSLTGADVVE